MPFTAESKSAVLNFAKEHKVEHHIGFENFTKDVTLPESIVLDIEDKEILQQTVARINELNKNKSPEELITLRVAAGGQKENCLTKGYNKSFSMTPCAEGNVILRLVGNEFQKIEVIDEEKHIVRVGANVQIGELDNALYNRRISLPTSSLIPYVTIAGLIANAGHGTGRNQPSVAGLIRAMTICRPDGKIERIDKSHPDFETIRASHLGLFGVVLDVEIECIKGQKLQCVTEARSINELIAEIKSGLFYKSSYVSIMYVPTYQKNERDQKNVIVYRWEPVDLNVESTNNLPKLSEIGQSESIKLNNLFNVPELLTHYSSLIPTYMKYLVARMEVGSKDALSVGPWPDIAHYQTAYPWDLDDADYLFTTRGKSSDEIVTALNHVVTSLETFAEVKQQYPVIDAVYLRFFKGTNGGLSTSATQHDDEYVCGLDIVSSIHVPGYTDFKNKMEEFFMDALHAKPHWGKTVPLTRDYAKIYGEQFTIFKEVLRKWVEQCGFKLENSAFLNSFFRSVLQIPVTPALSASLQKATHPVCLENQSYDAAKQILSHIKESKLDNVHIRELKESLQGIADKRNVTFHFVSDRQRNSFFQAMGTKAPKPAPAEHVENTRGCSCAIL